MNKLHHAEADMRFIGKAKKGKLIISVELKDDVPQEVKDSPEAKEFFRDGAPEGSGFMKIGVSIQVGDLTEEDICGCNPEQYLDNGIIAGILDAIRHGLSDERGINFKYATEAAQEKGESALQITGLNEMLGDMELAMAETEGDC